MVPSQGVAIFMIIITTFMWGSWFQCIKRLGKYPVSGFILLMYTFSFVLVWLFIGLNSLFGWGFISGNIMEAIGGQPMIALGVIVCGALFAIGMRVQMEVVKKVGLILSTSITASCNILFGTLVSMLVGGIREGLSAPGILFAAVVLVAATIVCQIAGKRRTQEQGGSEEEGNGAINVKMVISLILVMLFLATAYPLAMAFGVKTNENTTGFESLVCVGLLSVGSLIGSWIYSSVVLTKHQQWRATFLPERKTPILLAMISAFCHYGGNIIHTIAIPAVSTAIAWPMGTIGNLWTYIWGILYGEFKGSSKKTYAILGGGILLFILGVILLATFVYW